MSRRRSEWPEPWVRLQWSDNDLKRIGLLLDVVNRGGTLPDREWKFVKEMALRVDATLQQVAWLRVLARRYKADPDKGLTRPSDPGDRHIELD